MTEQRNWQILDVSENETARPRVKVERIGDDSIIGVMRRVTFRDGLIRDMCEDLHHHVWVESTSLIAVQHATTSIAQDLLGEFAGLDTVAQRRGARV